MPASIEVDLLPPDEFIAQLEQIRVRNSAMNTEFLREFIAGNMPRPALKRWSVEWYHFTARSAPLTSRAPYLYRHASDWVLSTSIENGMGELGYRGDAPHPMLARALCYGLGITDDEIDAAELLPTTYWYTEFMLSQFNPGAGADLARAALCVATEGDAADTALAIAGALKDRYKVDDAAAIYWTTHAYADEEHRRENLDIAVNLCTSRNLQEYVKDRARIAIQTRNRTWAAWRSLW
jgi:pyrroloquinoline quinone (PQQ) biosynthesis protein C